MRSVGPHFLHGHLRIPPFHIDPSNRVPKHTDGHAPPNYLKCFVTFGCQSRVKMTGRLRRWNKAIVRFVRGMIASPPGTPRAPPGQKSFWTSTTSNVAL